MTDDRLVVLNKDSDTLSAIDPETGATERVVETDFNPHEVAIGPDGAVVYVACSLGDSLLAFDAETWERLDRFEHEAFDFPHGLAVRESAAELWLASTYSSEVFVFDISDGKLRPVAHFGTDQDKSHMVALTPDEETAFLANIGSDNVTVVDTDDRTIREAVPVGAGPEGIAVHPRAGVLVANQDDGLLSILDQETLETTGQAILGETPIRVVPSPDGRHVLVPNRESNDVSVIDTRHERDGERRPWEIARIPVGIWPGGTVFAPDGERAFVANNKTNDVSVLDPAAHTEQARYETERHPDGIAYLER